MIKDKSIKEKQPYELYGGDGSRSTRSSSKTQQSNRKGNFNNTRIPTDRDVTLRSLQRLITDRSEAMD